MNQNAFATALAIWVMVFMAFLFLRDPERGRRTS
jgi:hypothetical protein